MGAFVFNVAKGRVAEFHNRVKTFDPSTSRLVIVAINSNGVTDAVMQDQPTLATLLGTAVNEVTNTGYARVVYASGEISTLPTNFATVDYVEVDVPDVTWLAVQPGDSWTDVLVCYIPVVGGADSTIVPLTCHDFVRTPDGNNITWQVFSAGYYRGA